MLIREKVDIFISMCTIQEDMISDMRMPPKIHLHLKDLVRLFQGIINLDQALQNILDFKKIGAIPNVVKGLLLALVIDYHKSTKSQT